MACLQCGDSRIYSWGNVWPPESGKAGNFADEATGRAFPNWQILAGYDDGCAVAAPVEQSGVNSWGLYGLGGNVWEVCVADSDHTSFGAWRGASWGNAKADELRNTYRNAFGGSARSGNYGFRLVLIPPEAR
jgi:formylglycine-generating enzyme required for sulfatase activity